MRILALFLCLSGTLFADSPSHKIDFSEGNESYYAVPVPNPKDDKALTGLQIFDSRDHLIQFVDNGGDLPQKAPGYFPWKFADCNFDGYVDIMLVQEDGPRFDTFVIWLWDPKQKKFVDNEYIDNAEISEVDSKKKYLYSGGSYGKGIWSRTAYTFSQSGKLVKVYTDIIDENRDTEVKTFYSDGKVTKTVTSAAPPQ